MNFILIAVLVLGAIALIAALVLFGVSKKFAVEEDPRLGQVGEVLPGANCGGCGFAGCSGMAAALVKSLRVLGLFRIRKCLVFSSIRKPLWSILYQIGRAHV